ncbi:MAG: amidohydrolase family protein [Candidatus Gastranaerophilales bacterium]|nr:amidohydrolase family protein [Candidatus Gastranaerophilales bacterium]
MNELNFKSFYKSKLLVEQHFHGAFGVDFSTCEAKDILFLAKKLLEHGIGGFYPTLVTEKIENIKRQIERIKTAKEQQKNQPETEMAQILGIHLEGIFINPEKKGIHDETLFLQPAIANYKLIEDDFIKIVTLAPELDKNGELQKYLKSKGIKVQAGHCSGGDLSGCSGVTHLFNAMSGINHRENSTALSALINDDIYTEIIADGIHLSDEILELIFKIKPEDKIILVSDSLPIAKSGLKETIFAGKKIFYDGKKATSAEGTIAGSTATLDEIVRRLVLKNPENFKKYIKMASENLYKYHNIELNGFVHWDEGFNVIKVGKPN